MAGAGAFGTARVLGSRGGTILAARACVAPWIVGSSRTMTYLPVTSGELATAFGDQFGGDLVADAEGDGGGAAGDEAAGANDHHYDEDEAED